MTTAYHIHPRRADLPSFVRLAGERGYGELVRPWSPTEDQRPALVAAPRISAEVSEAVQFAVGRRLRVAVQGTGHGASGSLGDQVALIATRYMDTVQIDRNSLTATVGAGTVWGALAAHAGDAGLAGLAGTSATVGVCGYLLGGRAGLAGASTWAGERELDRC